jgi:hypothetical protein
MGEKPEPQHPEQHRRHGEHPAGRKARAQQRRLAVEGAVTGRQSRHGQRQDRRLLDMESSEQAESDSGREDCERGEVRAIQPPPQAPGHEEEQQSGDASEEVRDLDHPERYDAGEQPHATGDAGRRPGGQHHDAGCEHHVPGGSRT